MSVTSVHADLSASPILEAVERYRGTIIDMDAGIALAPDDFAQPRTAGRSTARSGRQLGRARRGGAGQRTIVRRHVDHGARARRVPAAGPSQNASGRARALCAALRRRFVVGDTIEEGGLRAIARKVDDLEFADHWPAQWGTLDVSTAAGPTLRGIPLHPTSGSTGLPKIALRPGFAALEEARHYAATMAIDADDTIMSAVPMSHAYGYGVSVMVPLLSGASIVSTRRFSGKLLRSALADHGITVLPAVPAMLDVLAHCQPAEFARTRWVLTAGAMLSRVVAERFRDSTGVTPCPLYGTTETGGISVATAADGADVDGRVGPPMHGVSVEARPTAETLGRTDIGKLFVRSSSMMAGYLDEHGRISSPLDDEWFETGDLAWIDPDGTIRLRGRDSEVINVAGLKVVPCEVEEAINKLIGVREVRVYAGEHRSGAQIVKAAVAVDGGVTVADIRLHCEEHLVYYKRPQVVNLVDALPRTPAGKIARDQLP